MHILRAPIAFLLALGQAALLFVAGRSVAAAVDCVPEAHYQNVSASLCDAQAGPEARALMERLKGMYGKYTLSGNYVSPYNDYSRAVFRDAGGNLDARLTNELYAVHQVTGK
ncbi:MAG: hypothetical protein FWC27_04625, partial [Firmicutes bacterium]|nr:hypothetical protein [Bacillota bacterium]